MHACRTQPIDANRYYEWLKNSTLNSTVVSVPAIQELVNEVLDYGFGVVLLSGAPESFRQDLVKSLEGAGYNGGWTKLILK